MLGGVAAVVVSVVGLSEGAYFGDGLVVIIEGLCDFLV